MKIIDLSVPLSPEVKEAMPPSIRYNNLEKGVEKAIRELNKFGLNLSKSDFYRGKLWATEVVKNVYVAFRRNKLP